MEPETRSEGWCLCCATPKLPRFRNLLEVYGQVSRNAARFGGRDRVGLREDQDECKILKGGVHRLNASMFD